jgi:hypothetical protein
MRKIKRVLVLSETQQKFNGVVYYKCKNYYQKDGKRLHRVVYEYHKGIIPKGFDIHHKKDTDHNQIFNLQKLPQSAHRAKHMKKRHLIPTKACIDSAKKWHQSEEGVQWHKEHFERTKDIFLDTYNRKCANCDKKVISRRKKANVFCSNKCKTQFRKKSGIDDVERVCIICSNVFIINKYSSRQTCSSKCSSKLRSQNNKNQHSKN